MIWRSPVTLALKNLLVMVHDSFVVVATAENQVISYEITLISADICIRVFLPVTSVSVVFRPWSLDQCCTLTENGDTLGYSE